MKAPKTGIVVGHYNMPDVLKLNIAAIRHHCGDVPILISDDCSEGFCNTPHSNTNFGRVLAMQECFENIVVWANVERIGHHGGDMSAFWKGIVWGKAIGLDVVFKLSQRLIIDIPGWAEASARELIDSGMTTCGGWCHAAPWLRTEAIGMIVDEWHKPSILSHLTPRRVAWHIEWLLHHDIIDRLDNRLLIWRLFSGYTRWDKSPNIVSFWTDGPEVYAALAERLGVQLNGPILCEPVSDRPGYMAG
jgi:hypothetical protein